MGRKGAILGLLQQALLLQLAPCLLSLSLKVECSFKVLQVFILFPLFYPFRLLCSLFASSGLLLDLYREKAEQTIWNRLHQLKTLKTKRLRSRVPLKVGILGIW